MATYMQQRCEEVRREGMQQGMQQGEAALLLRQLVSLNGSSPSFSARHRGGWQGAPTSNSASYCEEAQRRQPPRGPTKSR